MSGPPPSYTAPTTGKPATQQGPPPMYSDQAPLMGRPAAQGAPTGGAAPVFKDVWFAVAFAVVVVAFVGFTIGTWDKNFTQMGGSGGEDKGSKGSKDTDSGADPDLLRKMGKIAATCTGIGLAFAALWLQICKQFPKQMIYIALITNVVVCFALAVLFFAQGIIIGGVIWLLFGGLSILFYYFWRRRIPLAAEIITTTTTVVQAFPAMVATSFGALFVLIAWICVWVLGASSAVNIGNAGLYVACVFVFYWVAQVNHNVVHVTSAGTFATWYFKTGSPDFPANPTVGALKRATSYSFGSICFGSLIIAIIETIRFLLRSARRNRNQFVIACADCLLGCLESIARYINVYAFTQVAVYGKDYWTAAKDTWDLFTTHGFDIIVNDDLTGSVFGLASFISAVMLALVAFAWGAAELGTSDHALPYLIALVIIVFFIGLIESITCFACVRSCVASLMVCFCTAPDVLQTQQPALYARFAELYGPRIGFLTTA